MMMRTNGVRARSGAGLWTVLEILFLIFNLVFIAGVGKKWLFLKVPPAFAPMARVVGAPVAKTSGRLNVLCFGLDSVDGTHRTDTILLISLLPTTGEVNIVSIPRDTRVVVDGQGRKINEIVARHGIQALRSLVEDLFEIRVDRYVKVDFQGFVRLIDLVGGLDLLIEHAMNYDDNYGKLHIHFNPGQTHLDGQKALEYVRFRGDAAADLGRIKRQQRFLTALLEKIKSPGIVVKLPDLVSEAWKFIETDFALAEALELLVGLRGEKLKTTAQSLPGEARYVDKISFYLPYKDQAVALGNKQFADLCTLDLDATYTRTMDAASTTASQAHPIATGSVPAKENRSVTATMSAISSVSAPVASPVLDVVVAVPVASAAVTSPARTLETPVATGAHP